MRPKEIQEKLGINADRIKLFKREGVFFPENPPSGNHGTEYTVTDFKNLQLLVVMTKSGLTCSDIRKMQEGELSLSDAIKARKKTITEEIQRKRNSLELLGQILDSKAEFETFETQHFWDVIKRREADGDEFINFDDIYGYEAVSLIREVECPYCHEMQEIDLEDFLYDESGYEKENGMGPDIVYSFDSEENHDCIFCQHRLRISGWIREYPIGAYDSEELYVEELAVPEDEANVK